MKNKKRNTIIAIVFVLVILYLYVIPQRFFALTDREEFHIDSVKVRDGDVEVDLTYDIDMEGLEDELYLLNGDRVQANKPERMDLSSQYVIEGTAKDHDFYIILNPFGFSYYYKDLGENGYRIQNAEEWYDLLKETTREAREEREI